ncbi:HAD-like domain-containing protein [Artemisia annua]|uniref:Mitochondrial import inner membrane translocase subunit TIM50 n=1 Tax=Artemisia annua TaxID=35608 RepID=A0A2U1L6N7_ARTAN|nr:HAD-like domain-containing protein [Artemisia annua]
MGLSISLGLIRYVKRLVSKTGYTEFVDDKMDSTGTETTDVMDVSEGAENTGQVNGEMGSSGTTSLESNGEAIKRRKRRKKKKKPVEGVILNPHDNMEDAEIVDSELEDIPSSDIPVNMTIVRTLAQKLPIGNVEILNDHNGGDPKSNHVIRSRKMLLVLDVNGLLADIIQPPPKDRKSDINIKKRAIFKRPFLDDFLAFCFDKFEVAIWSSRTRKILVPVVDYLLGDLKDKLLFLWDLSHCTNSSARSLENAHKFIVFKNLQKIWEEFGPNLASENGYYDESNTLLLDDTPYKALLNSKHTGIFPLSYSYKDMNDNALGPDGDLRVYLEGIAATENVKMYVEQHQLGQHAIDETSPHWDFYSEALKDLQYI